MADLARDHYAVLGVYEPADCTPEEALARIQAAVCISPDELKMLYHQEALRRHPDKLLASHTGAGSIASTEAFQQLQTAWNCLHNPKTRNEYNKWLLADAVLKCRQAKTQRCLQPMPAVTPEQMPAVPPEQMPVVPPVPPMQAEPITAKAGSSDNPLVTRLKTLVRVRLPGSTDKGRAFKNCDHMNADVCSQVADTYFAEATNWMRQMEALTETQAREWMRERRFAFSGTRADRINRTPAHTYIHR